ncbi:APC family permease [Euzebya sp.]|uniref:APC family permease n=1 Tax=Euzebya sp. TaxID=1971409 RepID=UPI003513F366
MAVDAAETTIDRSDEEGTGALKRVVGSRLLFFFIVGDMLGGGIYALVGEVGGEVGGAIWAAFLAAFVMASLTAFAYVELVTKYPRAAGAALYVNRAFKRPFVTFVVAFIVMASGLTSAATLARGFAGDYLTAFVDAPVVLSAIAVLVVLALVNLWGVGESVKLNVAFTLIEIVGLMIIVGVGIAALTGGGGGGSEVDLSRNLEFAGDSSPWLVVLAGASLAFYALIGFEDSVNLAEEVRRPSRAFPIALFGGLVAAGVIYVVVTVVASAVVPTDALADSDGPLLEVIRRGPGGVSEELFSAIALFALANGALINMIMASRLMYGMSEEGILPPVFGKVLPGRRTPVVAIALSAVIAIVLAITGDLGDLADTTVLLLLLVFAVVNVSVLVLRRESVGHDHYVAPTALPALGAVVSLGLATQNEAGTWLRAGLLVALGLVLWAVNRALGGEGRRPDAEEITLDV